MALDAGVMSITIEFAKDLKDQDWFGKQDPYCQISVGGQRFRTRTAIDGGKNPVWNETFSANVINENSVEVVIKVRGKGLKSCTSNGYIAIHSSVCYWRVRCNARPPCTAFPLTLS